MNKDPLMVATGCIAAAIAGYLLAFQPDAGTANSRNESPARSRSPETGLRSAGNARTAPVVKMRDAAKLAALKEDLCGRFASSPFAGNDLVMKEETAAILATMSPQELEAFAGEMQPKSRASIDLSDWMDWRRVLCLQITRQWGLKDPTGASLAHARWQLGNGVFEDWMRRDPEAAAAWVTDGHFPDGTEQARIELRNDLLNRQVTVDFAAASEALGKMDWASQVDVLQTWSRMDSLDSGARQQLVALLANPRYSKFSDICYRNMVSSMVEKSPTDAAAFVESSEYFSDEQKAGLHHAILQEWATNRPTEAFPNWAKLKETTAPSYLIEAISDWNSQSRTGDEPIQWVMALDLGPARERFELALVDSLRESKRFVKAAEFCTTMTHPEERIRQLKSIKRHWEEQSPATAAEWFAKLPEVDQQAIEIKTQ